jgi:hypothetical protein
MGIKEYQALNECVEGKSQEVVNSTVRKVPPRFKIQVSRAKAYLKQWIDAFQL